MILICIFLCPLLFWHDIVYLPKEYYCSVPFANLRVTLWVIFNIYGIPLLLLLLIYSRITIFLHRQSNNRNLVIKQRQQRDLVVIRRILIHVGLLMVLGIPIIVLLIMFYIADGKFPLFFRIQFFSVSLSLIELSLSVAILTPQLKYIVLKKFQHNRVAPLDAPLPISIPIRN